MKTIKEQIETILKHCLYIQSHSMDVVAFKQSNAAYILALQDYASLSILHIRLKYRKVVNNALETMVKRAHQHSADDDQLKEHLRQAANDCHQATIYKITHKARNKPQGHLAKALGTYTDYENRESTKTQRGSHSLKKKTSIKRKASERDDHDTQDTRPHKKLSDSNHYHGSIFRKSSDKRYQRVLDLWENLDSTSESTPHKKILATAPKAREEVASIWESIDLQASESLHSSPPTSPKTSKTSRTHVRGRSNSQTDALSQNLHKNNDSDGNQMKSAQTRKERRQAKAAESSLSESNNAIHSPKEGARRHKLFSHTRSESYSTLKRTLEKAPKSPKVAH